VKADAADDRIHALACPQRAVAVEDIGGDELGIWRYLVRAPSLRETD